MEELTDNAEEIAEEGDSTKDEKKLGRLQFKVILNNIPSPTPINI